MDMTADPDKHAMNDYQKYRGKCKEMAEAACKDDASLRLVRGYYFCPMWGQQPHWWCERTDGSVVDPSAKQFPSKGIGDYIEFDGNVDCANCGKTMREDSVPYAEGRYAFCSYCCYGQFIGVVP